MEIGPNVRCCITSINGTVTVVFDKYTKVCLKGWERQRRYTSPSPDPIFSADTQCVMSQEKFLSNAKNETSLIYLLTSHLRQKNVSVLPAKDDANATTAINLKEK